MTWLEALVLGLIQGLTEFLPVSSSGHLEIGSVLLHIEASNNLLFTVIVHAATALSTVVVFRRDIAQLLVGLRDPIWNESWSFSSKIVLSMIPVGIVGVFFENEVEALFTGNMVLVGSALLLTSVLLFFTHFRKSHGKELGFLAAFLMGMAQAAAVLPGVSRSGATIATGLMLGCDKSKVTKFSFLMVLIPILGASLLKIKDYVEAPVVSSGPSFGVLLVGFLSAFIAGYLACQWMVAIVRKGKLTYFAVYCLLIGLIAISSQLL
ncbi:MAG: undecaprenyl-diphosphate phosphatase [Cyclobacteriaceae bacterium]|nr:undecaprenyl-diphosphate phosphatase [Cyclobacteriaceae bacterium HetDA_MAG_MS6]